MFKKMDVSSSGQHLSSDEIDFGHEVIKHVKSIPSEVKRRDLKNALKDALISEKITSWLPVAQRPLLPRTKQH